MLLRKLKDLENFEIGIDFSIKGRSTFNSMFGGIISLIYTVITVSYACLMTFKVVTFANTNFISKLDKNAYD